MNLRSDWQLFASCYSYLPLHQVKASYHFRDRMLNLKSCVHLHKVKLLICSVKYEFDSSCVVVTDCLCCSYSSLANLESELRRDAAWRFFNNFLVASLNSAIAFIQIDVVTVFITKNLDFNVSWALDILLKDHVIILEAFHRLILCGLKHLHELFLFSHNTHAFATSTKRGLDHDRETNSFGMLKQYLRVFAFAMVARDDRYFSSLHDTF